MPVPSRPKIYHITHIDRLESIVSYGRLVSDLEVTSSNIGGSIIGLNEVKQRRLNKLSLPSYPDLFVGECVPFYFCPRSVMLYLIYRRNIDLGYKGGQDQIIHLQADLFNSVKWANECRYRWVFTLSNAGSYFFEDRHELTDLNDLDWEAISSRQWSEPTVKEGKQAEFLMERMFPWHLIEKIGVSSAMMAVKVSNILGKTSNTHQPNITIEPNWYY